ncbi:MAG: dihydropteroate synthase [Bacteroidales bacterium]|nr:dihydropteroate synthase [Bacteroidales bacterium]
MKNSMTLNIKGTLISLQRPLVMGILNITPDSFYGGCRCFEADAILRRADEIIAQGGDIIDVGAYSSRQGADDVSEEEEIRRLALALPLIREKYPETVISVDTFRANVARYAIEECGAHIINDITAGEGDPFMFETIAKLNVPYIVMHMRGNPQTMQELTNYKGDITTEVIAYFSEKINTLRSMGVNDIILDPGFGFAKTLEQNYILMKNLGDIAQFKLPLLVGISRKTMIYKYLNSTPEDSLPGTIALNSFALAKGANILRVHDVKECVDTIKIFEKLR